MAFIKKGDRPLEKPVIRAYRAEDLFRLEAMESRVHPYRPGDEEAVDAMHFRAQSAQNSGDSRWLSPPTLPNRSIAEEFDAFWVAENGADGDLLGIAGAQEFHLDEILPRTHELAKRWENVCETVELRRLRVAPEARRRGVGRGLSQTVIDWSRERGYMRVVVNTTTPQTPALALYRSLGFQDVGISYFGRYELVWLEMRL